MKKNKILLFILTILTLTSCTPNKAYKSLLDYILANEGIVIKYDKSDTTFFEYENKNVHITSEIRDETRDDRFYIELPYRKITPTTYKCKYTENANGESKNFVFYISNDFDGNSTDFVFENPTYNKSEYYGYKEFCRKYADTVLKEFKCWVDASYSVPFDDLGIFNNYKTVK